MKENLVQKIAIEGNIFTFCKMFTWDKLLTFWNELSDGEKRLEEGKLYEPKDFVEELEEQGYGDEELNADLYYVCKDDENRYSFWPKSFVDHGGGKWLYEDERE